jgi:hypothetical protein
MFPNGLKRHHSCVVFIANGFGAQSFSNPTLELIAFWRQSMTSADELRVPAYFWGPENWEFDWRRRSEHLDDTLTGLCLPRH